MELTEREKELFELVCHLFRVPLDTNLAKGHLRWIGYHLMRATQFVPENVAENVWRNWEEYEKKILSEFKDQP